MIPPLLEIRNLSTYFFTMDGVVQAIDNVSFRIERGEILGIVGETGCGKTVTALSIMRLVPDPPGKIVQGEVLFNGEDLLRKTEREMNRVRGRQISMVFQEPMSALNPVFTVGNLIAEVIMYHQKTDRKSALKKCVEILSSVGMPEPKRVIQMYPFELSGGMRQRASIALGISCNPDLLITDEPTTALDVTIQAQILRLIKRLKHESHISVLLIAHDLGVIANLCDKMVVMYAGHIVEYGTVRTVFKHPCHPYTIGLMGAIPKMVNEERLRTIRGTVPNLIDPLFGCRFHPRCERVMERCSRMKPGTTQVEEGHWTVCFLYP